MSEWQEVTIEQIKANIPHAMSTGPFGSAISSKFFTDEGVPVIRGGNLSANISVRLSEGGLVFVSPSKAKEFERSIVRKGDLVFTCWGTINQIGLIDGTGTYPEYVISNKQMKLTPHPEKADSLFLYYLFSSHQMQEWILGSNIGSSVPGFNLGQLKSAEIYLPPLPEQKAIADVLSSLDDKIDLLQRQNQTLEAVAQTLFRQWFVEGADNNWEEKPLDEIANYLNGLACQKYPPKNNNEKLPVLKIRELRGGISNKTDWATTEVPSEYIIENGDVIFSWSGSLMVKIWNGGKCVLNQHLFKVTSEHYPKWFYYLWTIHHLQKFIAIAESKATTMGHIKRRDLSSSMVLTPTPPEMEDMDSIIAPLIDKITLNNQQIKNLTLLRDTLLPKLLSGDVRVKFDD